MSPARSCWRTRAARRVRASSSSAALAGPASCSASTPTSPSTGALLGKPDDAGRARERLEALSGAGPRRAQRGGRPRPRGDGTPSERSAVARSAVAFAALESGDDRALRRLGRVARPRRRLRDPGTRVDPGRAIEGDFIERDRPAGPMLPIDSACRDWAGSPWNRCTRGSKTLRRTFSLSVFSCPRSRLEAWQIKRYTAATGHGSFPRDPGRSRHGHFRQPHRLRRPRHGGRPRHREHARLRPRPRHRALRAIGGRGRLVDRRGARGRRRRQADARPDPGIDPRRSGRSRTG